VVRGSAAVSVAGAIVHLLNSGWHEPRNWQFLQELDAGTLRPIGHPREMVLRGERRKLEKNWRSSRARRRIVRGLFHHAASDPAVFARGRRRHRVSRVCVHGVVAAGVSRKPWRAARRRPAVLAGREFWSFCHSVHTAPEGYRYAAAAYRFAATPPFAPTSAPLVPLDLGQGFADRRAYPRLNPAVGRVVYPCGAAHDDARWLISHGINDEQCAISLLSDDEVAASQQPRDAARR